MAPAAFPIGRSFYLGEACRGLEDYQGRIVYFRKPHFFGVRIDGIKDTIELTPGHFKHSPLCLRPSVSPFYPYCCCGLNLLRSFASLSFASLTDPIANAKVAIEIFRKERPSGGWPPGPAAEAQERQSPAPESG